MMSQAFNKLVKRIKRKHSLKALPYLVVVEAHKSGQPHFHVMLRAPFIDQRWLSEQWSELTGAFIVGIEMVRDQRGGARYVSKYVTKVPAQFGTQRRWWCSQDWDIEAEETERRDYSGGARRVLRNTTIALYLSVLQQAGWSILRSGRYAFEARAPHSGVPPPLWDCATEEDTPFRKLQHRKAARPTSDQTGAAAACVA